MIVSEDKDIAALENKVNKCSFKTSIDEIESLYNEVCTLEIRDGRTDHLTSKKEMENRLLKLREPKYDKRKHIRIATIMWISLIVNVFLLIDKFFSPK